MINFPHTHGKKMSGLEFAMSTSSLSSESSFEKHDSSKIDDVVNTSKTQTSNRGRRGSKQRKKHSKQNKSGKNITTPQHNDDSLSTLTSEADPKAVTFRRTAKVRRIRPRYQYSKKEQEDMWYTDDDYAAIKSRAIETVKKMKGEIGGFIDTDDHTSRGLECRLRKSAIERKEFKAFARSLVLEEQEDQRDKEIRNSGRLRKVYRKASAVALMKAQDKGQQDAEAVNDVSQSELLRTLQLVHSDPF